MNVFTAAERGDLERVRAVVEQDADLVDVTDDIGWTSLYFAASRGHLEVARYLLDHGATANHRNHRGGTALHWACFRSHTAVVLLLLERGAEITAADIHRHTSLMIAASHGYDTVVKWQLEHSGSAVDAADENGRTACHLACSWGRSGMLRQLLEAGADPTLPDAYAQTAIDLATEKGHHQCVTILQEWEQAYLLRRVRGLRDASSMSS